MKRIPVAQIRGIDRSPYKIPARDDDGQVIFDDADRKRAKLVTADTRSMLALIALQVPQELIAPKDGARAAQLFARLDAPGDVLELDDKLVDWYQSLLRRECAAKDPVTGQPLRDELSNDEHPKLRRTTYGRALFGINDRWVAEQLLAPEDRNLLNED